MPDITVGDTSYALDEKGYLIDFASWNRELAAALAAADGIAALGPDHWRIIDFLRAHQAERGVAPMIRVLCRETGCSLQQIYDLFPKGPAKGACRVAGLPRPDSCV
ncbi:TusE/DsrC/DsvC family sulfur relay protein [bacterium]|nr:TusE/DsrC/DsvC family sulfur relay protein [bacterium]